MFRMLNLKRDTNWESIEKRESSGPIGQTWIPDTLSAYLKEPKGRIIDKIRVQIENLNVAPQKKHCKGIRNPGG